MSRCSSQASSPRELIEQLGGASAIARELGVTPAAVANWATRDVPGAQHVAVLVLAVQRGVYWRPPGWPPSLQLRWYAPAAAPAGGAAEGLAEAAD